MFIYNYIYICWPRETEQGIHRSHRRVTKSVAYIASSERDEIGIAESGSSGGIRQGAIFGEMLPPCRSTIYIYISLADDQTNMTNQTHDIPWFLSWLNDAHRFYGLLRAERNEERGERERERQTEAP